MASEESLKELSESLRLATRPMTVALVNVERKIDDVAEILRPIPQQIVRLETKVDGLDEYKASHEKQISILGGKMQNIEITMAHAQPSTKYIVGLVASILSALMGFGVYKLGE